MTPEHPRRSSMFTTRSHSWREAGLVPRDDGGETRDDLTASSATETGDSVGE